MIKTVRIKNFKSIKDSGEINFSDRVFVLAGQNESGKSSILEALNAYESEDFDRDNLNFEEEENGNLKQEVSCTYSIEDHSLFVDNLIGKLCEEFSIEEETDFIDIDKLNPIKEYTVTKIYDYGDKSLSISVNNSAFGILKSAIKTKEVVERADDKEIKKKVPIIELDSDRNKTSSVFFLISPLIVLFNTFSDLLPDKILVSDLENQNTSVKGYNAVKNLEKLLNKDFVSISKLQRSHKNSTTSAEVENLSKKFQGAWKQRIHEDGVLKIGFMIENENIDGQAIPTIFFSIETKDKVLLEPRKRSKGMIWFLSAWLDLKSREDGINLVVLYDEPGLYLHIKAHKDILELFDELKSKGHQVIYSTHSPSLINTSSLNNIGLVLNTKDEGTIVEGLTTSKINTKYKQDALQPIAEAMGLEPLKDFSVLSKNNVLLEGISDFWYFQSMAKLLDRNMDYKFVPGIGIAGQNIFHLISFCIGYGLNWVLIMDNGNNPKNTREELKKNIFDNDENNTNEKIYLIPYSEVEDMFSSKDLNLIDNRVKIDDKRKPSSIIGKRKVIFSKIFSQNVDNNKIKKENLSEEVIKRFEDVFNWIDQKIKINL
jgi:predicted ATP-dependent endonuclease of OLD family